MFEIEDIEELYALQKGLMEIRFNTADVDWAVQGSPILSHLHNRTVSAIIAYHESSGESRKAQGWRDWRCFSSRVVERHSIRTYLVRMWQELQSAEAKRAAIADQMRPFTYSEYDVEKMFVEIESDFSDITSKPDS